MPLRLTGGSWWLGERDVREGRAAVTNISIAFRSEQRKFSDDYPEPYCLSALCSVQMVRILLQAEQ